MSTRVMVVDDDPDIRSIVKTIFEGDNYTVQTCPSGEEALEQVKVFNPELIILDVMMPGMDGYHVCSELKKDFETAHIPVILLTAKQDIIDLERGVEHSIDDYIAKPFSQRELLARAKMVLSRTRYQLGCNPLTGLPGNLEIEHRLKEVIRADKPYSLFYADIDRFKSFNDYYGYARGDSVIRLLTHCLVQATRVLGKPKDFVGHIGGDDFMMLCYHQDAEKVANRVIELFTEGVGDYFDETDLKRNYYEIKDRTGCLRRYPATLTLTVELVSSEKRRFTTTAEIADVVTELKKFGKGKPGNIVVHERRGMTEGEAANRQGDCSG
ncbi:MAG: response regulator [bacterium]|nr:response regulator [bacterium]